MNYLKCVCDKNSCPVFNKCCFLPTECHFDKEGKIRVLFVGQGGGSDERKIGRPFIGKAGKRLRQQIILAMKRYGNIFGVAFSNIIRDNPENNRVPTKEELNFCLNFLYNDIDNLKKNGLQTVITLGKASTNALLDNNNSISVDRGKKITFKDISIIPTYHPSYFNFQGINFTPEKLDEKEELVIKDILLALETK
jgi:uracil-DNA glycosylase family 4